MTHDLPEGLRHLGGGWYELPDGQRVRGRAAALAAWSVSETVGHTGHDDLPPAAAPAVPDAPVSAATHPDEPSRFETAVAIGMVVAAILGALVAWRASTVSDSASGLFDLAAQQLAQREQLLATAELRADHDVGLTRQYGEHVRAQRLLADQAADAQAADLTAVLERRSREEQALARTLSAHFLAMFPATDEEGRVSYDRSQAVRSQVEASGLLADIRPDDTIESAQAARTAAVRMVGVVFLAVGALFLLTLAEVLTARTVRRLLAGGGTAVLVASAGLFVLIEVSS